MTLNAVHFANNSTGHIVGGTTGVMDSLNKKEIFLSQRKRFLFQRNARE
ncbi:MAG: hypothetical protein ACJAT4_002111 [Granulosicoccus sp.]